MVMQCMGSFMFYGCFCTVQSLQCTYRYLWYRGPENLRFLPILLNESCIRAMSLDNSYVKSACAKRRPYFPYCTMVTSAASSSFSTDEQFPSGLFFHFQKKQHQHCTYLPTVMTFIHSLTMMFQEMS
jgi:hypothetical protein